MRRAQSCTTALIVGIRDWSTSQYVTSAAESYSEYLQMVTMGYPMSRPTRLKVTITKLSSEMYRLLADGSWVPPVE